MPNLFADLYDETGNQYNLVYNQPIVDPEWAHAEVLERYRHSPQYRPNDYIYFTNPRLDLGNQHARVNLGPDRYLVFWLQ